MTKAGFFAIVFTAAAVWAQGSAAPPFSYEGATGPAHWGDLSPEYSTCKTGKEQSPVDIRNARNAALPALQFEYKSVPLRLLNNGHTIQVNYAAGSFLVVGSERYELKQLHFHYPSEERIDGRAFDMVIHLVHANSRGEIAVVSLLVEKGAPDKTIQAIWDAISVATGKEHEVAGVKIDASKFLPSNPAYYSYKGSLTTPPCTEGVTWLILETPVKMSAKQIQTFSSTFSPNARPVQTLGERTISRSR